MITPAAAKSLRKLPRSERERSSQFAPDRLSVWPMEDGRYGLDATYHGATGFSRAEAQRQRLQDANLGASVRQGLATTGRFASGH